MSPDEFMKAVPPDLARRATSKLESHRDAIHQLRAAGYSLRQVCAYLKQCGVTVSLQMVSKFLRPRTKTRSATVPGIEPAPVKAAATGTKSREEIARDNPGLSRKQIDDKYVDQYAVRRENPLLKGYKPASEG